MHIKKPIAWVGVAGVAIVCLVIACTLLLAFQMRPGIRVSVRNTGDSPLRSVVLHVTGRSYSLGDIAPNAEAAARVVSTGDSHLEVEFSADDGEKKRLVVGSYFEPGYRGTIRVQIQDGKVVRCEEDVRLY